MPPTPSLEEDQANLFVLARQIATALTEYEREWERVFANDNDRDRPTLKPFKKRLEDAQEQLGIFIRHQAIPNLERRAWELRTADIRVPGDPWAVDRAAGIAYGVDYRHHLYYDLQTLLSKDTIQSGHFSNLKIQTGTVRVWLSRMTVADGAEYNHAVEIEVCDQRGDWHMVDQYQAKGRRPRK